MCLPAPPAFAAGGPAGLAVYLLTVVLAWTAGQWRRAQQARIRAEMRRAVVEERARIAREVHDVVAHTLSVMITQAGAADDVFTHQPEQGPPGTARHRDIRPLRARRTTACPGTTVMRGSASGVVGGFCHPSSSARSSIASCSRSRVSRALRRKASTRSRAASSSVPLSAGSGSESAAPVTDGTEGPCAPRRSRSSAFSVWMRRAAISARLCAFSRSDSARASCTRRSSSCARARPRRRWVAVTSVNTASGAAFRASRRRVRCATCCPHPVIMCVL